MSPVDLGELYTPLDEAYKELLRRREDRALTEKVRTFFDKHMPPFLGKEPRLFLSRPIITPNKEFMRFYNLIAHIPLDPIFLEYDAKFVSKNKDHYHAAKICFLDGLDRNETMRFHIQNTVDFNLFEGTNIVDVKTMWGEDLRGMHRRLLHNVFPQNTFSSIINCTEWFNIARTLSEHYYFFYLALFIHNGILMENFILRDHEENSFLRKKVWPSFLAVSEFFDIKPLISPILPLENEELQTWLSYNKNLECHIKPFV